MRYALILSLISVTLATCTFAPSDEEIRNADYGIPIPNDACIAAVESRMKQSLLDPYSVIFEGVSCGGKSWQARGFEKPAFGYRFSGAYNAKNSFGAYVGLKRWKGIIRDDGSGPRVVAVCAFSEISGIPRCL